MRGEEEVPTSFFAHRMGRRKSLHHSDPLPTYKVEKGPLSLPSPVLNTSEFTTAKVVTKIMEQNST